MDTPVGPNRVRGAGLLGVAKQAALAPRTTSPTLDRPTQVGASFISLDTPPAAQSSISRRIENWARAHRWFEMHGRTFSLEGNYRSPQSRQWEEVPQPKSDPIDFFDAWILELAWRALPTFDRWVLKFQYHNKMRPGRACRLLRTWVKPAILFARAELWESYIKAAEHMITMELLRRAPNHLEDVTPPPLDILLWVAQNRRRIDLLAD